MGEEKRLYLNDIEGHYSEYAKYVPINVHDEAVASALRLRYAEDSRKRKALRQSDFLAMALEADINFHKANKPFPADAVKNLRDAYYEGREIKQLYSNYLAMDSAVTQGDESRLSRAYGTLALGGQLYSVFDAERSNSMRTTRTYEGAYLDIVSTVFACDRPDKRILLADDCKMLPDFLFHSYVPEGLARKRASSTDKLLEDAFYECTYLIPKTKEGIVLLKMMRVPNLHERLNKCLGLSVSEEDLIPYDIRSDGKKVQGEQVIYELNFLDMNLDELLRFIRAAGIRKEKKQTNKFRIHCLDIALDGVIRACDNEDVEVIPYKIEDVWEMLGRQVLGMEDKS